MDFNAKWVWSEHITSSAIEPWKVRMLLGAHAACQQLCTLNHSQVGGHFQQVKEGCCMNSHTREACNNRAH